MADIFISYSKVDRDKVVMLATYLESEGWTVWWDKRLSAGEPYRDEIMRELVTARAVIVLWTSNSIKSDFVRAEAGRAKADGKLIPVKTDDVAYGDIPLPFGEMHTESLWNNEVIRAAVLTQLARPMAQPSAPWTEIKAFHNSMLIWFGVIGSVLTVFTSLRAFLDLADWASWIVSSWQAWTHVFWQWLLSFFLVTVPPHWSALLSSFVFCVLVATGLRIRSAMNYRAGVGAEPRDKPVVVIRFGRLWRFVFSPYLMMLVSLSLFLALDKYVISYIFPFDDYILWHGCRNSHCGIYCGIHFLVDRLK